MLAFEVCVYNFLMLESFGTFLLIELNLMSERGIVTCDTLEDRTVFDNRAETEAEARV